MAGGLCSFGGCGRAVKCKGLCGGHYQQQLAGRQMSPLGSSRIRGSCSFEGCDRPHRAKGYCNTHRIQHLGGKPLTPIRAVAAAGHRTSCSFEGCEKPINGRGLCGTHRSQLLRGLDLRPISIPAPEGARRLNGNGYAVVKVGRQWRLEHAWVMSEKLGRPLVKGESVHHINGVRDDNRPENLELWSISQPPGQRVVDKVAWAKELLALYESESLAAA